MSRVKKYLPHYLLIYFIHVRDLVGKSEGRRPLARPRFRREDNIKMDFREVGWAHELDRSGSPIGTGGGLL
jgi:hypothetical protein